MLIIKNTEYSPCQIAADIRGPYELGEKYTVLLDMRSFTPKGEETARITGRFSLTDVGALRDYLGQLISAATCCDHD